MPTRFNTKIPANLFITYAVLPLDLYNGDTRVKIDDFNESTEYEISEDETNPDCFGVIELYRDIGPILMFASTNIEEVNEQMNRRVYHLKGQQRCP